MYITDNVMDELKKTCTKSLVEQVFLLGCRENIMLVDVCANVSCRLVSKCFCVPDVKVISQIIEDWYEKHICFCGVVHSHLTSKKDFSEADVQFAKKIYESFLMPLLWLGIVNVHEDTNVLQMYKIHKYMNELRVLPESVEYLET